jgi:hypothetical protein
LIIITNSTSGNAYPFIYWHEDILGVVCLTLSTFVRFTMRIDQSPYIVWSYHDPKPSPTGTKVAMP